MFLTWKSGLTGLGLSAVLALTGCASTGDSGPKTTSAAVPSTQAVACSKCQVTYVKVPANDPKGRFYGYSTRKEMECPGCKTAAQAFFETGKLEHQCTHCSGTMEVCEGHT
jgi:hypothetical protein